MNEVKSKMDYADKTKEELLNELLKLQQELNTVMDQYHKETSFSKLNKERSVKCEEKLVREHFLLNALMNNLADHVYIKDLGSRFIRINKSLALSFGLDDPDEAIGKTDFDFFTEEHAQQAYEDEQKIIRTGQLIKMEEIETWADRPSTCVVTTKMPIRNEEGEIIGTFGISTDISERRRSEEALNREQFLVKAIMDYFPDHIYFKDKESRFIRINKAQASYLGLKDPNEAVGKTDSDFFTGEHAMQALQDEQNIIRTGQLFSIEEKDTHHDRPDIWVSTIKLPLRDKEENIIGTFGISRDITERRSTEEALSKLFVRQEAILAAVPEIIMEVDNNKIYTWVNRHGLEFFGKDVIGKEASFYFEGEQETYKKVQPLFDGTEDTFYLESWQRRYDGEKRLLAWWCQVLRDKDGNVTGALSSAQDITERKLAEDALAQEQYLVSTLMNNLPDRIYFKDLQSRFIRVNKAHSLRFGLSNPNEVIGKTDFDLFSIEHAQQAFDDEQTIIRTRQSIILEEKETHHDRPDTWASTIKIPLTDRSGNIIGTFGISRDVTARKRKELESEVLFEITRGLTTTSNLDELLKLIHQSLSKVVYAENCFIALMDKKTGLFSFPFFVDKVDSTPAPSSMSKNCSAYVFRTVKPLLLTQDFFDLLKEQNEVEDVGTPSPSWIGIPLQTPLRVIGVLVLQHYEIGNVYSDSDFRFLISIGSKIAFAIERKQSETALFESERDLNESQKIAGLGSYNLNFLSGCWTSSEILDSIFGIDDNYLRSVNGWFDLIHPSWRDQMKEYLQKDIIEKRNKFDKEYKIIRKSDNSERWVHGKGELIIDSENNLISMFGSILDITQRKQDEEEILLKNQMLHTINAEKDKFFSILAHDLRGPLSAFVAATQIISEEIQTMGIEEIKELTESMKISATNIYRLLENLLEWSRLKRGGMDFVPEKINLRQMIELYIEVLSESAKKKNIEIVMSISDKIFVLADNHMLDATVRNLVSNAIKFTPAGGKVTVAAENNSDHLIEVKITDSGIGMSQELKEKLFVLNEKTSRPGTDGEPSTGLGLLLCKEFIEKNGGKIWVESEVGMGSTFSFSLPVAV